MVARIASSDLPSTSVYFPGFHPSIHALGAWSPRAVDIEFRLARLANAKIIVGASHFANPQAVAYFSQNRETLRTGTVAPYLGATFHDFRDYFEFRSAELFDILSAEYGKLGIRYTRDEHSALYFGQQDPEQLGNFLDENVRQVVSFDRAPASRTFDFIVSEEIENLAETAIGAGPQLRAIARAVSALGERADPLLVSDFLRRSHSVLPSEVSRQLDVILHRTYSFGGLTQLGRGLITDSAYLIGDPVAPGPDIDERPRIVREVLRHKFDPNELLALDWRTIEEIARDASGSPRLQRAIESIRNSARKDLSHPPKTEAEDALAQLSEAIAQRVDERWRTEKSFAHVGAGLEVLDRNWRWWSISITAVGLAFGGVHAAAAGLGASAGSLALIEAWKRWGPTEFTLFATRVGSRIPR